MRTVLVVAAFLFVPAGALAATDGAALDRASARWSAQHLRNYSFRLTVSCFCPTEVRRPTVITVRDGVPHGYKYFKGQLRTIPEMFRLIRHTLGSTGAGKATITYDARRGFPRKVALDPIKLAIDDELYWTVDRFRAA